MEKEIDPVRADPAVQEAPEAREEDPELRRHFQRLLAQCEQVRRLYPSFDLAQEMANPLFARLTAPRVGLDPLIAYEAVHREELRPALLRDGARRGARALAETLRDAARPAENGVSAAPGLVARDDPRAWSAQERAEIRRRVRRGEKIRL